MRENPMQSPEHIRQEKQETGDFSAAARLAAEQAYQEVALEYQDKLMDPKPGELYWQPLCQEFSEKLFAKLKPLGARPRYVYINKLPKAFEANFRHHVFLAAADAQGEDYFIDGTWQQFLDQPNKETGLLLAKTREIQNTPAFVAAPKEISGLWQTGKCMLETAKLLSLATPGKKTAIRQAITRQLEVKEKDLDAFLNLKCFFSPEKAAKILAIAKTA